MRHIGTCVRRASHRRSPLRLGLLIGAAVLASSSTLATPAIADHQLSSEEMPVVAVHVDPSQAPALTWVPEDYRGIRPDDVIEHQVLPQRRDVLGNEPLPNPHRGLRLELFFNAADLTHPQWGHRVWVPATVAAHEQAYGEGTKVTQVYFYLHDYIGGRVPEAAIRNMQSVFNDLRRLGYTVVLRFAYERLWDPTLCGADEDHPVYELADITQHVSDLTPLVRANAGLVTSWEAGFLGNWGEWGPNCTNIQQDANQVDTMMRAIVNAAPPGMPVIMRYPWHREMIKDADTRAGVGFYNDYFSAGYEDNTHDVYHPLKTTYWNGEQRAGYFFDKVVDPSPDVVDPSPNVMVDGEMAYDTRNASGQLHPTPTCPLGPPAPGAQYQPNIGLDPIIAAQRLQSMHYSTFSVVHNDQTTFACWRSQYLAASQVIGAGLPADPMYFQDSAGREVSRTAFDYIRDHLGYRLRLTGADFGENAGGHLPVKLRIVNDGFSAPHIPRTAYVALLNEDGTIVNADVLDGVDGLPAKWTSWRGLCSTEHQVSVNPRIWRTRTTNKTNTSCDQPTHTVEGSLNLKALPAGEYRLGLWLPGAGDGNANYAARLANADVAWLNGVNVVATVRLTRTEPPPEAAQAPTRSGGANPNTGAFTLTWPSAANPDGSGSVTYTLQHKDADDAQFTDVATGLTTNSYAFTASAPEAEGTWTYRVRATASSGTPGQFSPASASRIVVDRSGPNTPELSVTLGQTTYAVASVKWYRDQVSVTVTPRGDPLLVDASTGSGVNTASYTSPFTVASNGVHTLTRTIEDRVGNRSVPSAPLTVHVDGTAPSVGISSCPSGEVIKGSAASVAVTASDGESGLTADPLFPDPSGTHRLDTSTVGPRSATFTAKDIVGHITTQTCSYTVVYAFTGFAPPIVNFAADAPKVNTVKAGATVPVRFSLAGDQGMDIFASGYPQSVPLASCAGASLTTPVDNGTATSPTPGTVVYDAAVDQYNYVWQTNTMWAGSCRQLLMKLNDGTYHRANFKFIR